MSVMPNVALRQSINLPSQSKTDLQSLAVRGLKAFLALQGPEFLESLYSLSLLLANWPILS